MVKPLVTVDAGTDEDQQESSFMNATLQGAGEAVVMSISTSLEVPEDVIANGEASIAKYVQKVLSIAASSCPGLSFQVQVGPSRDAMAQQKLVGNRPARPV